MPFIAVLETQRVVLFELPREVARTAYPPIKLTTSARADLEASIAEGDAKVLNKDLFLSYRDESGSIPKGQGGSETDDEARRERAHQVITWVIADGYEALVARRTRFARIKEAAKKFACLPKTVNRWLGRYFTYGMVPNALYPLHRKKGTRGTHRIVGKAKRGRPSTFSSGSGCNVSKDLREKIQKHTKRELLKGKRTLRKLYNGFCERYFVDGKEIDEDGKETVVLLPQACKITFPTFKKYYYKDRNPTALSRLQHGPRHELDHREKLGSEAERARFAGAYLQVDFTIANVVLVHPFYRTSA